jgi:hypothetical protein
MSRLCNLILKVLLFSDLSTSFIFSLRFKKKKKSFDFIGKSESLLVLGRISEHGKSERESRFFQLPFPSIFFRFSQGREIVKPVLIKCTLKACI